MDVSKENVSTGIKKKVNKDNWGYAVVFGTVITFIAGIGHVNSFGLIYNDFINETKSTAKSLTSAHGVFAIMLAVGGIILNSITKRFSLRFGGLVGAVLLSTGSFSTILVSNTNQLPITFGVIQGIGFGMMVPVCYSTLNHYFVKKRTTVMSICKAVQGVILMWYPQLLKEIMSFYGFRGTLLIVAGMSLHTFPGMLAMRTDKVPRKIRTASDSENGKCPENLDLLISKENNDSVKTDKSQSKNGPKNIKEKILEILNVKILKDAVYCNICFGQSFVNFSDITFFVLQPMLMFQYGFDKTQVAMCISICAAADVGGRFLLALVSSLVHINTRLLFYLATLFTLIFRLVLLQLTQFVWMATVTAVLGLLRAWLHVASPLLISNHVPHEDFPGAYALSMLAAGTVNVTCSPLIGLLKDIYQDYVPAFYALALCCIPCLLFWPIEYVIRTRLQRKI
ncbi:monocarboxylate transporter 1-like [Trichoplusia ni]|uniref:Monocarboxylate transporter 1-like n=1 Tax=Trichoplusia ni TaxID=7111 RepID=A0A7E5WF86_TRINI|nr:monocarboxylate transporter 1-like [Trichoplusia ni]